MFVHLSVTFWRGDVVTHDQSRDVTWWRHQRHTTRYESRTLRDDVINYVSFVTLESKEQKDKIYFECIQCQL